MNILITGGTGFIGIPLTALLAEKGYKVSILAMHHEESYIHQHPEVTYVPYDYTPESQIDPDFLSDFDAVINLAGEPIFTGRWTRNKKKEILSSRLNITRQIVNGFEKMSDKKPRTLISASAVGYYGPRGSEKTTEDTEAGDDFLANVCRRWEMEAKRAKKYGVRTVILRTGIVMGKDGGALAKMAGPYQWFLGGSLGSGDQYISWIQLDDLLRIYLYALENKEAHGFYNATAPNPVTMDEFSRVLGKVLDKPSTVRTPAFAVRLLLGQSADAILTGQRVIPERLTESGFAFNHPLIYPALSQIFDATQ